MHRKLLFALTGAAALALAGRAGRVGAGEAQDRLPARRDRPLLPGDADRRGEGRRRPRRRGRDPDPADLGRRGADPDPRRADRARRSRLHHHRTGGEGPDGRPAAGRGRRRHQDHHRRHLPRRRRLRERPGHLPDQLHRLGQRRGRPHLGPRPRRGDRRQGQGLHQLHQPQRQLGPGPRAGLRRGDDERVPRDHRARPRLQPRRRRHAPRSRPPPSSSASPTSPASSAPTCSAPRARARR